MNKALLPSGKEIYCCERLHIAVSVSDKNAARRVERAIRRALKNDTRYLSIRIHADAERRPMQADIRWGDAKECVDYVPLLFAPNEQQPERVAECIVEALAESRKPAFERSDPGHAVAEPRPSGLVAARGIASNT